MDDFRFKGKDLAAFGATAAFGESMRTGAKVKRSAYSLPGGGSVIIGEDTHEETQRAVTIAPLPGVEATPKWRREILSWLHSGRGELIVYNDPDVMRIAQFDSEGTFGTQAWPDGALQMTMTLQPLCYAVRERVQTCLTADGTASIVLDVETAMETPLCIRVSVESGMLTKLSLTCGGRTLRLEGMNLTAGQAVEYDAGDLIGDVMSLRAAGAAGFGYVTKWAKLTAMPGRVLAVAAEGAQVSVSVRARGRWSA